MLLDIGALGLRLLCPLQDYNLARQGRELLLCADPNVSAVTRAATAHRPHRETLFDPKQ